MTIRESEHPFLKQIQPQNSQPSLRGQRPAISFSSMTQQSEFLSPPTNIVIEQKQKPLNDEPVRNLLMNDAAAIRLKALADLEANMVSVE